MSGKGYFVPPSQRQNQPPPQHYPQNGGYNDYAPPPGPPPGYQSHNQSSYGPPPGPPPQQGGYYDNGRHGYGAPPPAQPPRPSYGSHGGPPPGQGYGGGHNGYHGGPPPQGGNYGPPRNGHGHSSGGGGGNGGAGARDDGIPWVPPRSGMTRLTRKSWLWTSYNADGETVCEIGPDCKGETYYSCKFGMSGRTKVKTGGYDNDGALVGEVATKGFISSKYYPKFNGFETELKKGGYSLSGSVKVWSFEVPINGRTETFVWTPHDKSMTARLTDQKGWELRPKGAPETSPPLVIYKDQEGNGFSSKTKMGTVEFVGKAASGQLGDAFPNLVIITLLNLRQQRHIENIASAVG